MKYTMEETLINKVLQYLGTKPYIEVTALISEIQGGVVPVEEAKEVEVIKE